MDNRESKVEIVRLERTFLLLGGGARIKIRKFLRLGVNTKGRRAEESSPSLQDFSNVYIATGTVVSFDRANF